MPPLMPRTCPSFTGFASSSLRYADYRFFPFSHSHIQRDPLTCTYSLYNEMSVSVSMHQFHNETRSVLKIQNWNDISPHSFMHLPLLASVHGSVLFQLLLLLLLGYLFLLPIIGKAGYQLPTTHTHLSGNVALPHAFQLSPNPKPCFSTLYQLNEGNKIE